MARTPKQEAHGLIAAYKKLYAAKYGAEPRINSFQLSWGFIDMISDLGKERAAGVVAYYFLTDNPGHSAQWLLSNYADLADTMDKQEVDREYRDRIMRDTERRLREFEARWQQPKSS